MKLKPGVSLTGIRPELLPGLTVAALVYYRAGHDMVITSVVDGGHSLTSLHYAGAAADLRTRDLPAAVAQQIRDEIAEALGTDFDVILEGTHIHLEWQPRRRA
jgi:hypothetical protein